MQAEYSREMTEKLRIAFGILGNITTILSSLAPIPTFYRIYKRKDTENFSVLPYATTISCNLFWAWYALPFITSQNLLLFVISAIQVGLQSVYLVIYFAYAPADKRARTAILVAAIVLLFAMDIVITLAFLKHNKRKTFAGVIATISSILAYAAPLSIMGLVIRTRSVEYMPFLLSLAIFCSGFTWTVYGILGPDIFVILALYAKYYQPSMQQEAVRYGNMKTLDLSEEMERESSSSVGENSFRHDHEQQHDGSSQEKSAPALLLVPQAARPIQFSQHEQVAMLYDDNSLKN